MKEYGQKPRRDSEARERIAQAVRLSQDTPETRSDLQQRLRQEAGKFDFHALIEGVSTLQEPEATTESEEVNAAVVAVPAPSENQARDTRQEIRPASETETRTRAAQRRGSKRVGLVVMSCGFAAVMFTALMYNHTHRSAAPQAIGAASTQHKTVPTIPLPAVSAAAPVHAVRHTRHSSHKSRHLQSASPHATGATHPETRPARPSSPDEGLVPLHATDPAYGKGVDKLLDRLP